jgi:putative spermidine/putrescine transport system permease protein
VTGARLRLGGLLLLQVLLLAPLAVLVVHALSRQWFWPEVVPATWTAEPFARLVRDPRTTDAMVTGLVVSSAATALALVLGVPAARALGLRRFRGRGLALALVVLPTTVPPLAVALGLNVAFLRLGLAGTVVGVVLVHLLPVLPYVVLALVGVFERYDEAYEWQAATLGAGPLTRLVRVGLPLLAPGIAVAALFGFLASWTQYALTLLVGGGQVVTLPLLVFASAAGGNPTAAAGLALLLALPPVVAVALAARALGGAATATGQQY